MIDDPKQTTRLMNELEAALPVEALVSPPLAAALQDTIPGVQPQQSCSITKIFYTGDEGGITCHLAFAGMNEEKAIVVSITHLMFDRRMPLARRIAAYQKHRVNRIRLQAARSSNLR